MIGGPQALALFLLAHPPCVPDPTIPPRPTLVNCSPSRVGEVHVGYRCHRFDNLVDGRNHVVYDWVIVAPPKPPAEGCDEPAEVCTHASAYTCRCKATGLDTYATPCEWQASEKADLP